MAALALYNRYWLKQRCLTLWAKDWIQKDIEQMRHYGLTFTGESYSFWCMTPSLRADYDWKGCKMARVRADQFNHVAGVTTFVDLGE